MAHLAWRHESAGKAAAAGAVVSVTQDTIRPRRVKRPLQVVADWPILSRFFLGGQRVMCSGVLELAPRRSAEMCPE